MEGWAGLAAAGEEWSLEERMEAHQCRPSSEDPGCLSCTLAKLTWYLVWGTLE